MKDLGEAVYILGIKIYRDRFKRLIGLSQDTYMDMVLKRFNMEHSKRGLLPMSHGMCFSDKQCPSSDEEHKHMSKVPYTIMYGMICTRLDVSYALRVASRYQANLGESH